jgi:hypothetical protein
MKHSILKNREVYISRWLKLHSKDINVKDANTNGFHEIIVKDQGYVQNVKVLIGTNQRKNSFLS